MKVITEYPIMVNRNVVSKGAWSRFDNDNMSYADAASSIPKKQPDTKKAPTQAQKEEAKKKGLTWDSVRGGWVKANEGVGLLTATIGGIKGLFGKGGAAPVESASAPTAEPEAPKKSNLPLIIGVGVAAVIIIAVVVIKNQK